MTSAPATSPAATPDITITADTAAPRARARAVERLSPDMRARLHPLENYIAKLQELLGKEALRLEGLEPAVGPALSDRCAYSIDELKLGCCILSSEIENLIFSLEERNKANTVEEDFYFRKYMEISAGAIRLRSLFDTTSAPRIKDRLTRISRSRKIASPPWPTQPGSSGQSAPSIRYNLGQGHAAPRIPSDTKGSL